MPTISYPSATVSDGNRTLPTTYPSYTLETYLQSPPTSVPVTERLIANQKPETLQYRKEQTKTELDSWSYNFERAAKPRD
ncbi:uncharacterized protein GGS25DRAFT_481411 [Hypoxylon fragiforme]|uniref:uncharacterized protein n=1 Tax=Hypoxylon fragiforme TaxID=63214 RepID=UPI0020C62F56|nr:uncharacterized protein GGS25DRAFT_481411 [Hypoxylon fragiforme]KAI2611105.1 hypothetical protein GGS25DRAFT_481411 [Hypoxylon fragiforme]